MADGPRDAMLGIRFIRFIRGSARCLGQGRVDLPLLMR